MRVFLVVLEVLVKTVIGVVSGAGVGTLVFGIGLVLHGVPDFNRFGPPPGPAFIGAGAGLLTTAAVMVALFMGPLSRRRWFVDVDSGDETLPKWKQAG